MLSPIDHFYQMHDEPVKSCLQFLRAYILKSFPTLNEEWKYGMPFFCYKGKMVCYLWIHKKYLHPYLGVVNGLQINHPDLLLEKRAKMKIMLIDPVKNIPVKKLDVILNAMMALHK